MEYNNISVLIIEGYARQVLPMAKAFREIGCKVTTLNASKLDVGYISKYPNYKIIDCCSKDDYEGTLSTIRKLIKTGKYQLIVPMTDFSAEILSKHKKEFLKYTKVASNDWLVFNIAQDKLKTMEICMKNYIPCPITLSNVNSIEDIRQAAINYPIVVKPRISYGAIGFRVFYNEEKLLNFLEKQQEGINSYVFQEYIPQSDVQFEVAMFVDNNNQIKSSLIFSKNRWFPIDGGSSTLNITIDRPDIKATCVKLMKFIGWRGCADIDLIQDPRDGIAKVMEINPRVSASVKICFEAGINLAKQIIEKEFGSPVTTYENYKIGQRLRCMHTDLLWFIKSPNRFSAKPSWFSIKNTKDQIFSIYDPLPWFGFTIQGLCKYRTEMKKRTNYLYKEKSK